MAEIGWGKPKIVFAKHGAESWTKMQPAMQNSTALNTEKGEKKEALIEGGEVEDVKYNRNKYGLVFTIRVKKTGTVPIKHKDGIVDGEYVLALQPEDPDVPSGIVISKAHVSVENGFSSTDGATLIYTFDAIVPVDESDQVKIGKVAFTENDGTITAVKFTELGTSDEKTVSLTDGTLS